MADTTEPAAAALEEIKERHAEASLITGAGLSFIPTIYMLTESVKDVPRLVAAVERILELHQPKPIYGMADDGKKSLCDHPFGADTDAHFEGDDGYWYCRDKKTGERCSSCADEDQADLWEEWPCPTVRAITRELSGEGGGDA